MAKYKPKHYKSGPKKGQFMPKGSRSGTRKRNPPAKRKAAPRKRAAASRAPARRSHARNPRRPNVVRTLTNGAVMATQVLAGKAAARAVPDLMNLPKAGQTGLAVQVAVALALAFISDMFFSKATSAAILAGGLTAPVETLIVNANIPFISEYLSPTAESIAVSGYVQPRRPLAGYVQRGGEASAYPAQWDGPEGEYEYGQYN